MLSEKFGDRHFLEDRLNRQTNGLGVLFTAWSGDVPAGLLYLWLEEAEEQEIAAALPGVALLTHLEVLPPLRSKGVGTELMDHAERYLEDLGGHEQVALAVHEDNTRAAALYDRLGYRDWGGGKIVCYTYEVQPDGSVVREPEKCHVLVKDLKSASPHGAATAGVSA
nr:GNAT family N-acetyltransferase [Amycolatopsis lexingtonensis]